MTKQLIIIGIDPGTTTAYAVLDTEGRVLACESGKQYDLATLIRELISWGKPLLVGCDKANIPSFVQKYATKVGARIIAPKHDMPRSEKKALVQGIKTNNDHESDALASALHAYKKIRSQLAKVNTFIQDKKGERYRARFTECVVKENVSLKLAWALATHENKEVVHIAREALSENVDAATRIKRGALLSKLYEKLKTQARLYEHVVKQNKKLKEQVKQHKKHEEKLKKTVAKARNSPALQQTLARKNQEIAQLQKNNRDSKKQLQQQAKQLTQQTQLFSRLKNKYVLKKIPSLHHDALRAMHIAPSDILLVANPLHYSEKALKVLSQKAVTLVVEKKAPKTIQQRFTCIEAHRLALKHSVHFATVDEKQFNALIDGHTLLCRVIDEHRSRKNL